MTAKIKPRLPVVICDPGCRDRRGHHYEFNNFLQEEVEISECLTNIHSQVLEYQKLFFHSPYSIVSDENFLIYQEQLEADAQKIAELSQTHICILHSVNEAFLKTLLNYDFLQGNLLVFFPVGMSGREALRLSYTNIFFDDWYAGPKLHDDRYLSFPRRIHDTPQNGRIVRNTIGFLGSQRQEKNFKGLIDFAVEKNLKILGDGSFLNHVEYTRLISCAEYIWLGYKKSMATKPSNTLHDASFFQKKMILSKAMLLGLRAKEQFEINTICGQYFVVEPSLSVRKNMIKRLKGFRRRLAALCG